MKIDRYIKAKGQVLAFLLLLAPLVLPSSSYGAAGHGWRPPVKGFIEGGIGGRFGDDLTEKKDLSLLEGRLQLKGTAYPELLDEYAGEAAFKADILGDGYVGEVDLDIRDLYLSANPLDTLDVKVGRQVITWGTGDLIFINDLFPKDYISFFSGRGDEYLKLPSDALRLSFYFDTLSLDVAFMPHSKANRSIRGDRFSFFDSLVNPPAGAFGGVGADYTYREPSKRLEDSELGIRVYGRGGRYDIAVYYFRGHYKEARGLLDGGGKVLFYPRLDVYGFSVRGPSLGGGIASLEGGYYLSREDNDGTDGAIVNSSLKFLFGYSRDMGGELSLSGQYLYERLLQYGSYFASLPPGAPAADEIRHLLTARVSKRYHSDKVRLSLFTFYSPSDEDIYVRGSSAYLPTDNLTITVGLNIFGGGKSHTEFGQFEGNDNIYTRVRYAF